MSEILQATPAPERTSTLDSELEKAHNSLRGKLTRRIGKAILGKDHPLQIVSGKEGKLSSIKDAGSTERSLDEARGQLEKSRDSRGSKIRGALGRMATGNKDFVPKKETQLQAITAELQQEISVRPEELEEAYAMDTVRDMQVEEIDAGQRTSEATTQSRMLEGEDAKYLSGMGNTDSDVLELRRKQADAHLQMEELNRADVMSRAHGAETAARDAAKVTDEALAMNPRPPRIDDRRAA